MSVKGKKWGKRFLADQLETLIARLLWPETKFTHTYNAILGVCVCQNPALMGSTFYYLLVHFKHLHYYCSAAPRLTSALSW